MSSDPLYRVVSTPRTSSAESVPKVISHKIESKAAELEKKAASTSGCQVEGEEEEVAVSCGDLVSQVMLEEYAKIA